MPILRGGAIELKFRLDMIPPTTTGQMRKVSVVNGKPRFYEPANVKQVRKDLTWHLIQAQPEHPISGPLQLTVTWLFPKGKTHHDGEWRSTRPDTDNLEKLLKDCMSDVGFWNNDAQVAVEVIRKLWSDEPGIEIELEVLNDVWQNV